VGRGWELSTRPGPGVAIGDGSTFDESVRWGRSVSLGRNVHVGPGTVLHDGVAVGDDTWIGPDASLGEPTMGFYTKRESWEAPPTVVGAGSILRKGGIVGAGTTIGERFQSGPGVAIRERTRIGRNVSIGNGCDVQYDVEIGDFTRLHSLVTVGSGTRIGPFVWVHPFVIFTNDRLFPTFLVEEPPVVAPFCVLAVSCVVLPGTRLGVHVVAGAGSEISGSVASFSFLKGSPAERVIDARKMIQKVDGKPVKPYPWLRHLDRDYPWKDVPPDERRVEDYVPPEWRAYL